VGNGGKRNFTGKGYQDRGEKVVKVVFAKELGTV